jgi:DNA (cytosine-5)-methyltransferase 1
MLTFGSLFAGIGGFDLGFERAGMRCVWQVEIDDYCQRVLAKHWPDVRRWDDVRTFPPAGDWYADVICGGFPCQDISNAGKRVGITGERSGLWTEFARVIGVVRPRIVVVENVAALLGRGMGTVLGDLSELWYDAEWHVVPAAAVGAPHIRERVWILANACGHEQGRQCEPRREAEGRIAIGWNGQEISKCQEVWDTERSPENIFTTEADTTKRRKVSVSKSSWWLVEPNVGRGLDGFPVWLDRHIGKGLSYAESRRRIKVLRNLWNHDVSQAIRLATGGLGRMDAAEILFAFVCEYEEAGWLSRPELASQKALEGVLRELRRRLSASGTPQGQEPEQQHEWQHSDALCGLSRFGSSWEAGIERVGQKVPNRVDRLRALGNAVVPQVAEWIGRRIVSMEVSNNVSPKPS